MKFWNQFELAIDKNWSLTKIEKIIYLKSLVSGTALNIISGLGLNENNNAAAVPLLKEWYGRHEKLVHAH